MQPFLLSHHDSSHAGGEHSHDCKETLRKVEAALDHQLSPEEEKALWDQLQNCNGCLSRYNIEKEFKSFLYSRIQRKSISPDLVNNIRLQLRTMAD